MARQRWQYLLVFFSYLSFGLAASPTTFCKCTCFSNSTIIPFGAYSPSSGTTANTTAGNDSSSHRPRTCNECTKDFCLSSDLPICNEATEDNVFTLCFQRDSTKDEAVIFIFIIATVGLLAWATVQPWVVRWREGVRMRHSYTPVGVAGGEGQ